MGVTCTTWRAQHLSQPKEDAGGRRTRGARGLPVPWAAGSCGRVGALPSPTRMGVPRAPALPSALPLGPAAGVQGDCRKSLPARAWTSTSSASTWASTVQTACPLSWGSEDEVSQPLRGDFWARQAWIHSLSLLLTSSVVLGKLRTLSVPPCPPVENGAKTAPSPKPL